MMMKPRSSRLLSSALLSAALLASPLAMADDHRDKHHGHHGKQDKAELCEQMREGTGKFSTEKREARMKEHQEKMDRHHAEIADRLDLNEEQRETWDEIRQERMEKRDAKMDKWQEKMKEHCAKS